MTQLISFWLKFWRMGCWIWLVVVYTLPTLSSCIEGTCIKMLALSLLPSLFSRFRYKGEAGMRLIRFSVTREVASLLLLVGNGEMF